MSNKLLPYHTILTTFIKRIIHNLLCSDIVYMLICGSMGIYILQLCWYLLQNNNYMMLKDYLYVILIHTNSDANSRGCEYTNAFCMSTYTI